MEIKFQSKQESNKQQAEAFLALSPIDRFVEFMKLSNQVLKFPRKSFEEKSNNLILELKRNLKNTTEE